MGAVVFDNEIFDSWLTKKSDEILSKVDREKITTEEMLILILKAQTNHFHHVDIEFRDEFKKIDFRFDTEFKRFDQRLEMEFKRIDERFEKVNSDFRAEFKKIDQRFETEFRKIDQRFDKVNSEFRGEFKKIDDRFEKIWSFQKWQAGMLLGLFGGLYIKLFLG